MTKLLRNRPQDREFVTKLVSNKTQLQMVQNFLQNKDYVPEKDPFLLDLERDPVKLDLTKALFGKPGLLQLVQEMIKNSGSVIKVHNLLKVSNSTSQEVKSPPILETKESLLLMMKV